MRIACTLALTLTLVTPVNAQLMEVRQTIFGMD
jgi:hypothetical protein